MSARKFEFVLTGPAKRDLQGLLSFTRQKWGYAQYLKYRQKVDKAIQTLIKNPEIGRKHYNHLVYTADKHHIYYRIQDSTIFIMRILHQRMNPTEHLDEEP